MAPEVARSLIVRGRVQGVFFRAFVREAAERHGLAGFARNRPDGAVDVRLEGEAAAVAEVERACSIGPERAQVEAVEAADAEPEGLEGFRVG